jgi:hypothetical protein
MAAVTMMVTTLAAVAEAADRRATFVDASPGRERSLYAQESCHSFQ